MPRRVDARWDDPDGMVGNNSIPEKTAATAIAKGMSKPIPIAVIRDFS